MTNPVVPAEFFSEGPDPEQALGFGVYEASIGGSDMPVKVVGHSGFIGCAIGFVPGRSIAIAMATNRLVIAEAPLTAETLWQRVLDDAAVLLALGSKR